MNLQYYPIVFDGFLILFNNPENNSQVKEIELIRERMELEYVMGIKLVEKDNGAVFDGVDFNGTVFDGAGLDGAGSDRAGSNEDISNRSKIIFPRKLYNKISNIIKRFKLIEKNQFRKESEKECKQIFLNQSETISSDNKFEKEQIN